MGLEKVGTTIGKEIIALTRTCNTRVFASNPVNIKGLNYAFKLKGDAVGTVVYLTNKKNGIFENEKNSTVSCYVCPKCGYVELNADNAKKLI